MGSTDDHDDDRVVNDWHADNDGSEAVNSVQSHQQSLGEVLLGSRRFRAVVRVAPWQLTA